MDEITKKNSPEDFAKFVFYTILIGVASYAAVSFFYTGILPH